MTGWLLAHPAVAQTSVLVRPLKDVLLPASGTASASVLAPNDAVLSAEISARVLRVHADAGANVARGDLLVQLDPADQQLLLAQADAALASARARLTLAEQRLTRGNTLGDKSFISPDELLVLATGKQAAAADLQAAQAQRAIAARSLEKCRVLAPFDGAVLERQAQVGALASAGTPLLRLVELGSAEVEAQLPAADAAALAAGDSLSLDIDGVRYPLTLLRLSAVIDPTARTRLARFAFSASAAPAGSSGLLHWQGAVGRVPAGLLVKRDGKFGVMAFDAGVARFIAVPSAQDGRPASADGLAPSLRLVVEGQQGLNEGDPITERAN